MNVKANKSVHLDYREPVKTHNKPYDEMKLILFPTVIRSVSVGAVLLPFMAIFSHFEFLYPFNYLYILQCFRWFYNFQSLNNRSVISEPINIFSNTNNILVIMKKTLFSSIEEKLTSLIFCYIL